MVRKQLVRRARGLAQAAMAVGVIGAAVGLGACGSSDDSSSGTTAAGGAQKQIELAVLEAGQNGYTTSQLEGINAAAKRLNAKVTLLDGRYDPATQMAQLRTAVDGGKFDALIVNPVSSQQVVPGIMDAADKDIAVVCMQTQCGPDLSAVEPQVEGQDGFVGITPAGVGHALAEQTIAACEGKNPCRVAFMQGFAAFPDDVERTKIVKADLARESSIKLVSVQDGRLAEQPAYATAQNVLTANDIDVYTTATDQMALGVERAIEGSDQKGRIKIVSGGASRSAVEAVKAGRLFSTVVTLPRTEGELAATIAIEAARGRAPEETAIDTISKSPIGPVVNRGNADGFESQWTE